MFKSPSTRVSRRQSGREQRGGTASVEVIFCVQILLILTFGTLEICTGLLIKQSITVAAFEGVRAGVGRGTTNEDIVNQTRKILEFRNVKWNDPSNDFTSYDALPDRDGDYGIFIETPGNTPVEDLNALDPITVRIVISSVGNASPVFEHLLDRKISAQVTMVREFDPELN